MEIHNPRVTGSLNISGSQNINGTLAVAVAGATEFQVLQGGVTIGNAVADNHNVSGALRISGSLLINGTSYTAATSGTSGSGGSSGSSGSSGATGGTGTSGSSGSSGVSGTSGVSGGNGTSGTSVAVSGTSNTITKFTSATTIGNSAITDNGSNTVQVAGRAAVIATDWTIGGSYPEALTIIGTYASLCFRNSNANYKWLYHTDASGVMRWYGGGGYTNTTWTNYMSLDTSGNLSTVGDITAYSDRRIKENIVTITDGLSKVLKLRGVSYNRNDVENKINKIGVIAQEVLEVVPELVNEQEDGMYTVSYGNMSALFIESFKEQQAQIDRQQKEIDELKELVKQLINK